jgi:uncharacterized protein YeaO (DUF488 family)
MQFAAARVVNASSDGASSAGQNRSSKCFRIWLGAREVPLRISTYAYGDRRRRGEGLRIGCARYLVRGVRSADYARRDILDVWLPTIAPSRKLLAWALQRNMDDPRTWNTYVRRYRREMKQTNAR